MFKGRLIMDLPTHMRADACQRYHNDLDTSHRKRFYPEKNITCKLLQPIERLQSSARERPRYMPKAAAIHYLN